MMIASAVPWGFLLPAAVLAWVPRWHQAALGLMLVGYLLALAVGQIDALALVSLGLLFCALWLTGQPGRRGLAVLGYAAFVLLALLLGIHALPGFHNLRVIDAVQFTPHTSPFTMYLNLDKPFVGFVVVFMLGRQWLDVPPGRWLRAGTVLLVRNQRCMHRCCGGLGRDCLEPQVACCKTN